MLDLDAHYFRDESAARAKLESVRWPGGIVCGHCGTIRNVRKVAASREGSRRRPIFYCCRSCKRQFTVTAGTVFASSHIPLHKWIQAITLLFSADRNVSVKTIERTLQITYKSAWFMVQALRAAERQGRLPRK